MSSWSEFESLAPELAADVRARFTARKHATMATLRADGSPRISGTEVAFTDGQLVLGSMPGAVKARDLQRDPRVAVHSPTVDPPETDPAAWEGEAKVSGRAVEVRSTKTSHTFHVDLTEVVHTRVVGDRLEIVSWHPDRGVQRRTRR
ncbi:MAG TPA: pyridoxamine 5'-phosphate oxidase family protein [Actinomycetes bacterium]